MCPKLDTLILTNNRLAKLTDIDVIATCKTLKRLSLVGNMVANLQNYRLYAIHRMPSLKTLDFQNITQKERDTAALLFTEKVQEVQEEVMQTDGEAKLDKPEAEVTEQKEVVKAVEAVEDNQMEECKDEKVQ